MSPASTRSSKQRRWRTRLLIALLAGVAADQFVHHVLLADGTLFGRRIAPYDPPLFAPSQVEFRDRVREATESGTAPALSAAHDPELGWTDEAVSHLAAGEREASRRIVAVGCSFTHGEEVAAREAWPAVVADRRAGFEVVNLGVSAYGTDQALLRYRRDGRELAPDEVWLGFVPSTLPRLESVYRPAYRHWTNLIWFKPRFVLDEDGALNLVPNPGETLDRTLALLDDQAAFVTTVGAHDRWVQRARAAYSPRGSHPAHYSGIARLVLTLSEVGGRPEPEPLLAEGVDASLPLFTAIVETMRREVEADGAVFRLVVLPGRGDLRFWRARGAVPSSTPTLQGLRDDGVRIVDVTPALLAARAIDDDTFWMPGEHYSPAANRVVAEAVLAAVQR